MVNSSAQLGRFSLPPRSLAFYFEEKVEVSDLQLVWPLALFQLLPVFWEWGWAAVLGAGLAGFAFDRVLGRGLGKCPVKALYVHVFCCSVSLENPDSHTSLGIPPAGRAPKLVQLMPALGPEPLS